VSKNTERRKPPKRLVIKKETLRRLTTPEVRVAAGSQPRAAPGWVSR
jgi:hypothetical protein